MKSAFGGKIGHVLLLLVVLLLVGLPVAVWLDLTNLAETNLTRQASDLNSIIASVRGYYASNVVGRILAAPGVATKVVHNYEDIPGAIPIPATLSLELGSVISEHQHNITYRFVSDYPFANRAPHPLDQFEADALRRLRENPNQMISADTSSLSGGQRAPGGAGHHGRGLRRLPQLPSGKPQARLEGRRRARPAGSDHHPADRRRHFRVQISAGLFLSGGGGRLYLHCPAAAPGRADPGHEYRA